MRLGCSLVVCLLGFPAGASAQLPGDLLRPERPPKAAPPEEPPPESEPREPAPREGPEPRERPSPRRVRKLSDERANSRFAFVVRRTWARERPRSRSRRVKLLRTTTPDGTSELVLTLAELRVGGDPRWVRVRLPMRPNGTTGWVPRSALGALRAVHSSLLIDRRRLRATLRRRGRVVWRSPIGVGQPQWPTPRGRFYVRERLIPVDPEGLYGVFAFGLSAYSRVLTDWPGGGMIGIHGTNQPELLPGRVSHGCIRLPNRAIARLRRQMGLGTPVLIR